MSTFHHGIFLLVFTLGLFSPVFSPLQIHSDCHDYEDEFEFCGKQRNKCFRESHRNTNCETKFCECLKEINPKTNICKEKVDSLCIQAKKLSNEEIFTQEKIMKEVNLLMRNLGSPMDSIKDICYTDADFDQELKNVTNETDFSIDYNRYKLGPGLVLNTLITKQNKTKACANSVLQFEKKAKEMDRVVFSHILIPMNQWRCGWNLGEIGQLILRAPFIIASPNTTMEFNHCCAAHHNCYFIRSSKNECDEEFKKCTQNVVNRTNTGRSSTMELKKILDEAHLWDSDIAYKICNITTVYEYATYSDNIEKAFDGFKNTNDTNYTVYILEPDHTYTEDNRKVVANVYKKCPKHKFAISSCLYIFLQCNKSAYVFEEEEDNEECPENFYQCISNIKNIDDECSTYIEKLKDSLGPKHFSKFSWLNQQWKKDGWAFIVDVLFIPIGIYEWIKIGYSFYNWIKQCFTSKKLTHSTEEEDSIPLNTFSIPNRNM